MSKELQRVPEGAMVDAKVIESLVVRGDLSGLGPRERALYYIRTCETLGLSASSQPFAFLRLNGKEILYATRGCTDQLAAIHKLTREVIDGPKVIDVAGTKLVYCQVKATHPNGRIETAVATVPLVDPVNVLMKCETKGKRRVTLSILGLGVLDEMELETIPANVQEPGGGVDLSRAGPRDEQPAETKPAEVPPALEGLYTRIGEIELPGEAVAVWLKYRSDLMSVPAPDRENVWKALCKRTEEVGKMKNAKVWLKKAIAEEDARRQSDGRSPPGHPAALEGAGGPRNEPVEQHAQDAPTGDGAPDTHDLDSEAVEEGPSSHAFNTFVEQLPKASTLAGVHEAYNALIDGVNEEGGDLEHWTQGDNGAGAMAMGHMRRTLGWPLANAECNQVLRNRPLAELLDTQATVTPSDGALKLAALWIIEHRPAVKALAEHVYRETTRYVVGRRYSGARVAAETKKALAALDEAVKLLDKPPTPPTGSGPATGPGGSVAANGNGATSAPSQGARAAAQVIDEATAMGIINCAREDRAATIHAWETYAAGIMARGDDKGAAHVAGSFWKRADAYRRAGIHAECLAITLDELTARGVVEAHTWLTSVGEKNGHVQRRRAA